MAETLNPLPEDRAERYRVLAEQLAAVVEGESSRVARFATASCMLAQAFGPRFFWTGFYLVDPNRPRELVVGRSPVSRRGHAGTEFIMTEIPVTRRDFLAGASAVCAGAPLLGPVAGALAQDAETAGDLAISVGDVAEILAEAVLIHNIPGFHIP